MYHPPLHRKLLPWAYALLFFVVAPLLLFYTAGYRYNLKKASVEKFGTLIIDSSPSNADITINDRLTTETSPATFQELAPGWHRVRVSKEGYTTWEKTLEVRAERATFANRIHLFQASPTPQLIAEGDVRQLASAPDGESLLALEALSASGTRAFFVQPRGKLGDETRLSDAMSDTTEIRWQKDGRAVLLNDPNTTSDALLRLTSRGIAPTSTSFESGHWEGADLVQTASTSFLYWNARTGVFRIENRPTSTLDQLGSLHLLTTTSGSKLAVEKAFSTQMIDLPFGAWSFYDETPRTPLLYDGSRFLWVDTGSTSPRLTLFEAQALRWTPANVSPASALLIAGNELLVWTPGQDPLLLLRQSTPIREVAWHESGDGLFFATDTDIQYLELDPRGGHVRHTLATFDHLQDIDLLGTTLYVAGRMNGQSGLWMITVE